MDSYLMIRRKNQTIFTDIKETATVYELKKIIEGIIKFPPDRQQLINSQGQKMNDTHLIRESGYPSDSAKAQNPGCLTLQLKMLNCNEFEPIDITPYSVPPELPDVMKSQEANGQEQAS